MASQSKAPKPCPRPNKPRPEPAEPILEDDPTDPDNGDPATWPEWTDRHTYTLAQRVRRASR